jgi:hypothetical protein
MKVNTRDVVACQQLQKGNDVTQAKDNRYLCLEGECTKVFVCEEAVCGGKGDRIPHEPLAWTDDSKRLPHPGVLFVDLL